MRLRIHAGGTIAILSALVSSIGVSASQAAQRPAGAAAELIGEWKLLSVDNVDPDGTRKPRHGAHPAGLLIFDSQGRYSLIVLTEGTPEEYKAAVEGNNADYGRYTVDPTRHTITFYMDHASHPELEGSSHTRYYTLQGDRLSYTTLAIPTGRNPTTTYGEVVLERLK
jgi:hypothetical protein